MVRAVVFLKSREIPLYAIGRGDELQATAAAYERFLLGVAAGEERTKLEEMLNTADIVFLCLPDAAAEEAVSLIENPKVKVIDTSTAHRVSESWVYGFPEIVGKETVKNAKRIANPGCHASGMISLIYPLIRAGLLSKDAALTCFSLTGYSGGGKKMIADYEAPDRPKLLAAPRQYGITQMHKHLPEMVK